MMSNFRVFTVYIKVLRMKIGFAAAMNSIHRLYKSITRTFFEKCIFFSLNDPWQLMMMDWSGNQQMINKEFTWIPRLKETLASSPFGSPPPGNERLKIFVFIYSMVLPATVWTFHCVVVEIRCWFSEQSSCPSYDCLDSPLQNQPII